MTPREKRRIALISVAVIFLAVLFLALYFIPTFVYFLFVLGIASVPFVYHSNDPPSYSREGHHPRPNLIIPPLIRRWLPAKTVNGVPSGGRVSGRVNRGRFIKGDSAGVTGETRLQSTGLYRRETELSTSLFSPRDILMGSYLGKPDSPSAVGRFGGAETKELRERLSRPNHAVHTPNRRLSFGESVGTVGRFTITPQRHYPIAQPGCSPVGMLAPVQWHGYKKKNILTPRNSPRVHSPVTVKIARPDHSATRSPFFNHLSSPLAPGPLSMGLGSGTGAAADPCSRETVLSVLKESRKREVDDDEERSFMDAQKSKRRRHGSSESSQSAFEPLTNGTPSHLVPKPGRMKRGMNTLAVEESQMKRSRTSSVSSLGSGLTPGGVPGSVRNPIFSSYSSSLGIAQKKPSTLSLSPLSSPGSSRSQTPERPTKKPREEVAESSGTAPTAKSDVKSADQAASTGKKSPEPMPVVTSPSGSGSSEGKRRRKVPLVPSRRGNISLPPAPELGYTITVMDLDLEKAAALEQIKKALEEPEPAKPDPATAAPVFPTVPAATAAAPSSGGLLLGSITSASSFAAPTLSSATSFPSSGLSSVASTSSAAAPAPAPASSLPNPLLESLRKMKDSPSAAPAPDGMALTGISAPTPSLLSSGEVKVEPSATLAGPGGTPVGSSATPAEPSATTEKPVPTLAQPVPTLAQPVPTLAQPVPTLAQPVLTPAQPVPTLAQPVPTPAEPVLAPAQPVPTPAEPVPTPVQPVPTSAQPVPALAQPVPTPAQPGPTPAQLSQTPAQPSSAMAPTIQLPSSVSGSTFGQVLPQPALSSATLQPSTFSLASVVKPPSSSSSATTSTEPSSDTVNPLPSAFKPIFGAASGAVPPSSTSAGASATPTFKPIFGSVAGGSAFGQSQIAAPSAPTSSESGSVFGSVSTTATTASEPALQTPAKSLFGSWSTAPGSSAAPTTNGSSFQFGTAPAASSAPALNPTSTAAPSHAPFQFGAAAATTAAPLSTQATFTFGAPSNQTSTAPTGAFSGFGTATSTATGPAPVAQPGFPFGKPSLEGPSTFSATPPAAPKPFAFGASGSGASATPFSFGAATTSTATFGTPSQSVFGGGTSGFSFGGTTGPSAVPAFGSGTQTSAPLPAPAPTFCFGGATASQPNAPAPSQATPHQPASGGFNFGAAVAGGAFGTPTPANPSCLTQNFNFGGASNATDGKPAFGTSTPAFGQSAGAPVQFGSPNFSPSTFGGSPAPAFSIGSGSKPSGARQRLQARRQHPRKK